MFRILGTRSITLPPNEPPTNLDRNSADLKELKAEIERVQSETLEIPCIIGGKEIYTGNTRYQVAVSQMLWIDFNIVIVVTSVVLGIQSAI